MRVLLDTIGFLWVILSDPRLSARAQELFSDPANQLFLSVVSSWEIAVKHSLGRLALPRPPGEFIVAQRQLHSIQTLPVDEESTLYVARLPRIHADPFDRMLICQAIVHGLAILTPDEAITQYPVRTLW